MSQPITDLDQIKDLAQQQRDSFEIMMHQLQYDDDLPDETIDAFVEAIAAPIIEAIDCTQCGNCCRALIVYLTQQDVHRLAAGTGHTVEAFEAAYIDPLPARHPEEWGQFRHRPCAFLDGKKCSVYAHRPDSCRDYPFFTPLFRWMLPDIIDGADKCPIIYNVLAQMVQQVDVLQRG